MNDLNVAREGAIGNKGRTDAECEGTDAINPCLYDAFPLQGMTLKRAPDLNEATLNDTSTNWQQSIQFIGGEALVTSKSLLVSEAKQSKDETERPDIANGLFDANAPLSHFDQVASGIYRSGRPNGEQGLREAVEKVWGDAQFDPKHAAQTSIVELRGPAPGKYYQENEDEINAEAETSAKLGITHARFPLETHDHPTPAYMQSVLNYIDQQQADGKRVLLHCFHGTDRTGTISAAYQLTHDTQLEQLLKNNPNEAFRRGLKSMTDNGFSPQLFPELTQSLKDFVDWKHVQLSDKPHFGAR